MKTKILLLLLFLTYSVNVRSQWQQTGGPLGGNINCFAVQGPNLLAGGDGGVFLSTDSGATWTTRNVGIEDKLDVRDIAVNGDYLFAICNSQVYMSTDSAKSWSYSTYVGGLCVAVCAGYVFAEEYGTGMYVSADSGKTWNLSNNGLPGTDVWSIEGDSSHVLVSIYGYGVYVSTDHGSSWSPVNNGLASTNIPVLAVAGNTCFAAGNYTDTLYYSTNYGANWNSIPLPFKTIVSTITSIGNSIYIGSTDGVYLSKNNGSSWGVINGNMSNTNVNSFALCGSKILVASPTDGVFISGNNGNYWAASNIGMIGTTVNCMAVHDTDLIVAANGGAFFSSDDGANWRFSDLMYHRSFSAMVLIGDSIFGTTGSDVLFSNDNGFTWKLVRNGLPSNAGFYALIAKGQTLFTGGYDKGVYKSTNYGTLWTAANNGIASRDVHQLVAAGERIFAATDSGVFVTSDNGGSWSIVSAIGFNQGYTAELAADSNWVCVYSKSKLYVSLDTGYTWTSNGIPVGPNTMLIHDGNIFLGSYMGGVIVSRDSAFSWTPLNNGLHSLYVKNLAIKGNTMFAGTSGGGVWKRTLSDLLDVPSLSNRPGFMIYPNPLVSSSEIRFKTTLKSAELTITDISGRELKRMHFSGNRIFIDKGNLSGGVYFVRITSAEGDFTEKLIVE